MESRNLGAAPTVGSSSRQKTSNRNQEDADFEGSVNYNSPGNYDGPRSGSQMTGGEMNDS